MRDETYRVLYGRDKGFMDRYMEDGGDYCNPTEIDIGSYGWHINYISSTFLNGWINYVKPVKAFTISGYRSREELSEKVKAFYEDKTNYHTDIGQFRSDVLMLCREEHKIEDESTIKQGYWFFWFDMDCSDCTIGRFLTGDDEAAVVQHFENHVRERAEDIGKFGESGDGTIFDLDAKLFRGWMSF